MLNIDKYVFEKSWQNILPEEFLAYMFICWKAQGVHAKRKVGNPCTRLEDDTNVQFFRFRIGQISERTVIAALIADDRKLGFTKIPFGILETHVASYPKIKTELNVWYKTFYTALHFAEKTGFAWTKPPCYVILTWRLWILYFWEILLIFWSVIHTISGQPLNFPKESKKA